MSEVGSPSLGGVVSDCLKPRQIVSLPGPVRSRLGLGASTHPRADYLEAATEWLADRSSRPLRSCGGEEVIYQAFLGPFLGFDGESGTFCSLICHLPFLLEDLRATTILLLPILRRGTARKKGGTGSPFAVSDPLSLDPSVSGLSPEAPVDAAWEALVGECRRIGVRLGMIVPLATISIDAPVIRRSPDLVHWWVAEPTELLTGEPANDRSPGPGSGAWKVEAVPAPRALHRFTAPPASEEIDQIACGEDSLYVAQDSNGRRLSVANAYPDPVVEDATTYAWQDVAAVRFANVAAPISYGDGRSSSQTAPNPVAVDFVRDVVRHRVACDGGVLLADVSSAIPSEALTQTVPPYPETMLVAEQLWEFRDREPFEFVSGPLIPCVAAHSRAPGVLAESLAYHLDLLAQTSDASFFFAGVANHDSVPCPSRLARALLMLFCLLPRSVPFLYSGTESACQVPTNMEFGELAGQPRPFEQDLLLFTQDPVVVDAEGLGQFKRFWQDLLHLREELGTANEEPTSISGVARDELVVSARIGDVVAIVNCDPSSAQRVRIENLSARDDMGVVASDRFRISSGSLEMPAISTTLVAPRSRMHRSGPSFAVGRLERD